MYIYIRKENKNECILPRKVRSLMTWFPASLKVSATFFIHFFPLLFFHVCLHFAKGNTDDRHTLRRVNAI